MSPDHNSHIEELIKSQTQTALKIATKITEFQTKLNDVEHYKIDDADILVINSVAHSIIDIKCPQIIHMEYIDEIAKYISKNYPKLDSKNTILHLGVGGGTLARFINYKFPDIKQIGVDIDEEMIKYVRDELELPPKNQFKVRINYAEKEIDNFRENSVDIIIRDIFTGVVPPPTSQTPEFIKQCLKTLNKNGVYIANILDDALYPEIVNFEKQIANNVIEEFISENTSFKNKISSPQIIRIGKKFKKGDFTNFLLIIKLTG